MVTLAILWSALIYLAPKVVALSTRIESTPCGLVDYGRLATAAQIALKSLEKPILGWGVQLTLQ